MIHEYAVDPRIVEESELMWQALEQFGVSHGRVIIECPKTWWKTIKQSLQSVESRLSALQYKLLEERCEWLRFSHAVIRRRDAQFDGTLPYAKAISREYSQRPFRAVVCSESDDGCGVPILTRLPQK
ncbi:MAG: hypothetical protein JNL58_22620 [Planctomyces sp.]|nr:hypothetical protein [Planctomyces sp.]